MAEITIEEARELCSHWLPKYGIEHGGDFEFSDMPEGTYADFVIANTETGEEIGVQHVRAMEDPLDDIVKPKRAHALVGKIKERFRKVQIQGLFVMLRLKNLPKSDDKLDDIAYSFVEFVRAKAASTRKPAVFRLDVDYDLKRLRLEELLPYVSGLEILPSPTSGVTIGGYDCADVPTSPHLDCQQKLEITVDKKSKHYGRGLQDVVLLVEATPLPFDSFFMEKARNERSGDTSGFREIWVINTSSYQKEVFRIA